MLVAYARSCGVLYDAGKKSLTYYRNGVAVGTPFNNVEVSQPASRPVAASSIFILMN